MTNAKPFRYYAATEEGTVVNWFSFISGETELTCESQEDAELLIRICKMFNVDCDGVLPYSYHSKPYWYIEYDKLYVTRYAMESGKVNTAWIVDEYIAEYTVGKLIEVSQEKWDSICSDYKGTWEDYYDECPEWKGRKTVMSGCITEEPTELGKLLVEGVHFRISNERSVGV